MYHFLSEFLSLSPSLSLSLPISLSPYTYIYIYGGVNVPVRLLFLNPSKKHLTSSSLYEFTYILLYVFLYLFLIYLSINLSILLPFLFGFIVIIQSTNLINFLSRTHVNRPLSCLVHNLREIYSFSLLNILADKNTLSLHYAKNTFMHHPTHLLTLIYDMI